MITSIKTFDRDTLFNQVANRLGVEITKCCRETKFPIPEAAGSGQIVSYDFENGLGLFLMDASLKQDWVWEFQSSKGAPLFINFASSGRIEWKLSTEKEVRVMRPMETLAVAQSAGGSQSLTFKSGQQILLSCIRLSREQYLDYLNCKVKDLSPALQHIFARPSFVKSVAYRSQTSISIAALVLEMMTNKGSGMLHAISMEEKVRKLLSLQLNRTIEQMEAKQFRTALDKADLERIQDARNMLIADLQEAPTIEELARRAGVNRQKLKLGFKMVFEKTINQYLRDERLDAARKMLLTGELNIRDVAALVGYENPGYFAKLFTEKYGVLPRHYQEIARRELN